MRVRIEHRPVYDDVEIYIWHDVDQRRRMPATVKENGRLGMGEIVADGAQMPAALTLNSEDFAALAEAIRQAGPLGSVEADALRDTREVRDRLLALVEAAWDA